MPMPMSMPMEQERRPIRDVHELDAAEPGAASTERRGAAAPSMFSTANAALGGAVIQRKLAERRLQQKSANEPAGERPGRALQLKKDDAEADKSVPTPAPAQLARAGDTGILTTEVSARIGDADVKLAPGTVVEVVTVVGAQLKVKVQSGRGGALAEIPATSFQSQPGVAINMRTEKPRGDVYADFGAGALWEEGGPKPEDLRQGAMGDCYLIAAMGAVCAANPGAIRALFAPQTSGAKAYSIRLHREERGKLTPQTITVDTQLPALSATTPEPGASAPGGAPQLAYAGKGETATSAVLWPSLIEKAYAQLSGGYARISQGGATDDAMAALTGIEARSEAVPPKDQVLARFRKYQEQGRAVACGTLGSMEHKAEKAFRSDGGGYAAQLTTHEGESCSVLKNTLQVKDAVSKAKPSAHDSAGKMVGPGVESGSVEYPTGKVTLKFLPEKGPDAPDNLTAEYNFRGRISKDLNLYSWHAYIFVRVDGDNLVFKNPWGSQDPKPIGAEQFAKLFSNVYSDEVPKPEEAPPGGGR